MTPVAAVITTGKRNMLASLAAYLRTHLAPTPIIEAQYHQVQQFPSISMQDGALFGLGEVALGRVLQVTQAGTQYKGKVEQTQVEFNCMAQLTAANRDAEVEARNMRDRLKWCLENAGEDGSGLPAIEIMRYTVKPPTGTGFFLWHPSEVSAAWNEAFIANDTVQPQVKRYRIYARIYWHEMQQV